VSKKPLGRKAYGHVPHLPMSRMGPGDHSCHEGQARIATKHPRDKHDRIIVTEKLDGSNVSVANLAGSILAIVRAGYLAQSSPYAQHHVFAEWVKQNYARFVDAIEPGQRIVGEWIYQAHGTIYNPVGDPFIPFDVMEGGNRLPWDDATAIIGRAGMRHAHVISDGPAMPIADALRAIGDYGYHGATETVEGAVWRVERRGSFDFMAKFVRPDKQDGKYLPGINGNPDGDGIVMFPNILRDVSTT
jgi:hypothetical protein